MYSRDFYLARAAIVACCKALELESRDLFHATVDDKYLRLTGATAALAVNANRVGLTLIVLHR
jgi:hypothetical protein